MQLDEDRQVGKGIGRLPEGDLAGRLGAPDLPSDLVALLLGERIQKALEVDALRQRQDRADVLALDVEGPVAGCFAPPEGNRQPVGHGVTAAKPAQVHDVPGNFAGDRRFR